MPKISDKRQAKRDQIATLHQKQAPATVESPHNHYITPHLPYTGLTLVLGLDGTLKSEFNPTKVTDIPAFLADFLYYCLKTVRRVVIFTDRSRPDAIHYLAQFDYMAKSIKLACRMDMTELQGGLYKVLKPEFFNSATTLIIDDDQGRYVKPQRGNLIVASPDSSDFKGFYDEVISFLKVFKPKRDIESQIQTFCEKAVYCKVPSVDNTLTVATLLRRPKLMRKYKGLINK